MSLLQQTSLQISNGLLQPLVLLRNESYLLKLVLPLLRDPRHVLQ
jgi:hypothetical protein